MAIMYVGYSKAKRPILGRTLKVPKSEKQHSRNTLKLFYAANGSKKRLIFENDKILKSGKSDHIAWAIVRQNSLFWDGI